MSYIRHFLCFLSDFPFIFYLITIDLIFITSDYYIGVVKYTISMVHTVGMLLAKILISVDKSPAPSVTVI